MADQWYVARGGKKHGPFTTAKLKRLVLQGRIQPTDKVIKDGMTKWVAASSVTEFCPADRPEQDEGGSAPPSQSLPEQSEQPAASADEEKSTDNNEAIPDNWFIVVALVFCFPFGLFMVWTHPHWSTNRKWLWTGTWAAIFVIGSVVKTAYDHSEATPDADPKSAKNAKLKIESFRELIYHIEKLPGLLDGSKARTQWGETAEKLRQKFNKIPFDATANRDAAKELVSLYQTRIEGKYTGAFAMRLQNDIEMIAIELVR